MVDPGKLNRRVTFLLPSTTQDSFGAPTDLWTPGYRCWASIDIQTTQLLYSTAEFVSQAIYRITVRYPRGFTISPKQRVVYTDTTKRVTHTYLIQTVTNDKQANETVTLMCYELDGEA